ncbi:MAG: GAF domain-containing protein [Acidobacteriota bacterium]
MAETLEFTRNAPRETIYVELVPQVRALVAGEPDAVANMANIAAVLREALGFFWVGFYVNKDGQLVLGPFQGPLACTRIDFDRGVCGHAYTTRETVIVPDVAEFPGHVACSSASRSEIVVPIFGRGGDVFGVLDVDSNLLNDFSATDSEGLGRIVAILEAAL